MSLWGGMLAGTDIAGYLIPVVHDRPLAMAVCSRCPVPVVCSCWLPTALEYITSINVCLCMLWAWVCDNRM